MARIIKDVEIDGKKLNGLFDTGSMNTYITEKFATSQRRTLKRSFTVGLGGKHRKIIEMCIFEGEIEGLSFSSDADIIENIGIIEDKQIDIIIGARTMERWEMKLDPKTGELDLTGLRRREFTEYQEGEKISIMDRIAEANKAVTTGIEEKDIEHWVTIYIMGRAYKVPAGLTIMQAMEYAGYKFVRSAGCRAGFCGACATVYRKMGEYKLKTAMACQTRVEDGMYLVQIPFTPAEKATYDIEKEKVDVSIFFKYYPEVARCLSCNTCTKACPQDLQVMDYIQAAIKGDFFALAEESFDCIQCGLCAMRCPAEIVQYHIAQLARRMYGRYESPEPEHLKERLKEIEKGKYEEGLKDLTSASIEKLEKLYAERKREKDG